MNPAITLVVCGLLHRNGQLLVAKRALSRRLGGLWEFPGGKLEAEESDQQALAREWQEELGCQIEVLTPLPPVLHGAENAAIELRPYWCRLAPGSPEPRALEHEALAWVEPQHLHQLEWCPPDLPIIRILQSGQTNHPDAAKAPA
jgi:8-oxo-dGTP diphosphatase